MEHLEESELLLSQSKQRTAQAYLPSKVYNFLAGQAITFTSC
jgi:hypothetical protein